MVSLEKLKCILSQPARSEFNSIYISLYVVVHLCLIQFQIPNKEIVVALILHYMYIIIHSSVRLVIFVN